jgi:hypothetical protein
MKISRPSPAMVVAGIALFVSLGGTSMAAVNYARKAGAVDGKSAVSASSSLSHAAGRLVATRKHGDHKGRLPGKFVYGVPKTKPFNVTTEVVDNTPGVPQLLATLGAFGTLTSTCRDQNPTPGIEDPISVITFNNTSGVQLNVAHHVGTGETTVGFTPNQTASSLTIRGSNTFTFHVEGAGHNAIVTAAARQEGQRTPAGLCAVYGVALDILP